MAEAEFPYPGTFGEVLPHLPRRSIEQSSADDVRRFAMHRKEPEKLAQQLLKEYDRDYFKAAMAYETDSFDSQGHFKPSPGTPLSMRSRYQQLQSEVGRSLSRTRRDTNFLMFNNQMIDPGPSDPKQSLRVRTVRQKLKVEYEVQTRNGPILLRRLLNWTYLDRQHNLQILHTTGDGNCLVNAILYAITGDQSGAYDLRYALSQGDMPPWFEEFAMRWSFSEVQQNIDQANDAYCYSVNNEVMPPYFVGLDDSTYNPAHGVANLYQQFMKSFNPIDKDDTTLPMEFGHCFYLANILRRPIIIFKFDVIHQERSNPSRLRNLSVVNNSRIFLPLLRRSEECCKNPILIHHHSLHYEAIVYEHQQNEPMERLVCLERLNRHALAEGDTPLRDLIPVYGGVNPGRIICGPIVQEQFEEYLWLWQVFRNRNVGLIGEAYGEGKQVDLALISEYLDIRLLDIPQRRRGNLEQQRTITFAAFTPVLPEGYQGLLDRLKHDLDARSEMLYGATS